MVTGLDRMDILVDPKDVIELCAKNVKYFAAKLFSHSGFDRPTRLSTRAIPR